MLVCSGSSAVESGEETSVCSEYSAGTVTGTFLSSKTEPQRLYRGPLGSPSQIPSHGKVLPAWLLARLVQLYKSCRRALCKPYVCTAKDEEGYAVVRQQKASWKNQTFPSLFWSENPGLLERSIDL